MKIVQLCPYDMDRPGGVQRHVRDLSSWLTAAGHETRIVCPPTPGARDATDGVIRRVGGARNLAVHGTAFEISRVSRGQLRAAVGDLRAWGADLVHVHTPWTPFMAAQMMRALDLPTVATVHATLPDPAAAGLIDRYIRWSARRLLPRADAVVAPSEAPLRMLNTVVPQVSPRIMPPTIDLAPWLRAGAARARGAGLSVLFLGRLEPRKGLDIALDAWCRIAPAVPDARLTIAGDGPMRDLAAAAASDRVAVVGRPDDAEARRLMAAADLCLAPAPYGESFGLILVEAMAAGTLPVAAANEGYGSVLTGDGAALLVTPDDATALAASLVALSDPAIRAPLQRWAAAHAQMFDVSTQGPAYLALFDRVLAGRNA